MKKPGWMGPVAEGIIRPTVITVLAVSIQKNEAKDSWVVLFMAVISLYVCYEALARLLKLCLSYRRVKKLEERIEP